MSVGFLDPTFNPTGSTPGVVRTSIFPTAIPPSVAIQADGKIVEAGTAYVNSVGAYGAYGFGVARYNGDGSVDTSFNGTGTVFTQIGSSPCAYAVAIQPDGKIVVAGTAYLSPLHEFALARYTTTGALDLSFGHNGTVMSVSSIHYAGNYAYAMVIQPDGKIVLAGRGTSDANSDHYGIDLARFNSDGSLDRTFTGHGENPGWVFTPDNVLRGVHTLTPKNVAIDSAGRLVVEGVDEGGSSPPFVAQYNFDGTLDKTLGGTGVIAFNQFSVIGGITSETLQPDGKIVLTAGGDVIRLNADGSLDTTSFGPLNPDGSHTGYVTLPTNHSAQDVQLESDGKMVVGCYGGHVVRLLSDGTLDPSFGTGGLSQQISTVSDLAIQPADGNIVAVGAGFLARFVGDTPTPATASTLSLAYFQSTLPFFSDWAGSTHTFTVWAENTAGGIATGYTGTVHFTSSDPQAAVLPADYTFTAADHGAHTFNATLKTAGPQSLTATDTATGSLAASETGIVVRAAAASQFSISAPASVTSGVAFSFTVTALDPYGNVANYYIGTVHVISSDPSATLPANYTFAAADNSVHTFSNAVILRTNGVETLMVTDLANGTIFGTISVDVV